MHFAKWFHIMGMKELHTIALEDTDSFLLHQPLLKMDTITTWTCHYMYI